MILLNRNNLAVRFAASDETSRHALRAILATEHETVATDGHVLARVSVPDIKAESFPQVNGFNPNGFTRGLIPVDSCKDIERAIPKSKNLPILNNAAITTEHVGERDVIMVATTDLDTPKVFTVRQPEGSFPAWDSDSLWPSDAAAIDICFNASLLASVAQAASKFSDRGTETIRLRFYSADRAMRFDLVNSDGQEMNGLLMPLRGSVEPTFKAPKQEQESAPLADTAEAGSSEVMESLGH